MRCDLGECIHYPVCNNQSSRCAEAQEKAIAFSLDRSLLLQRLKSARSCLSAEVKTAFGKGKFNFEKKRLEGDNGAVLQWQLRGYPNRPQGYGNQQTTEGTVAYYPAYQVRNGKADLVLSHSLKPGGM